MSLSLSNMPRFPALDQFIGYLQEQIAYYKSLVWGIVVIDLLLLGVFMNVVSSPMFFVFVVSGMVALLGALYARYIFLYFACSPSFENHHDSRHVSFETNIFFAVAFVPTFAVYMKIFDFMHINIVIGLVLLLSYHYKHMCMFVQKKTSDVEWDTASKKTDCGVWKTVVKNVFKAPRSPDPLDVGEWDFTQ